LILLKLIYSSLIGIPQALSKRREIMAKRKISSRKFGELLQMFGISAKEIFLHPKDLIFEKNYSE
jgi:hypothetical protein